MLSFVHLVILAGACLGHLVLMVGSHNWFYGLRLPKKVGSVVHLVHGALVLAFPAWLVVCWGSDPAGLFDLTSAPWWQGTVVLYLIVCELAGLIFLPAVTVYRLLRREPVL